MKWLFLFLLFIGSWQLRAQSAAEKDLQRLEQMILEGKFSEKETFEQYEILMWRYRTLDRAKSFRLAQQAIDFARSKGNVEWESRYTKRLGTIYNEFGQRDSGLLLIDRALGLIEGKGFFGEEASNHEHRAMLFDDASDHKSAMEYYLKAMDANAQAKLKNEKEGKDFSQNIRKDVSLLTNIGGVYYALHNRAKAIECVQRGLEIIDNNKQINFSDIEHQPVGNLASAFMDDGRYREALPLLERYYQLALSQNNPTSTVYALQRLSSFYLDGQRDIQKARSYAVECLQVAQKTQQPFLIVLAKGVSMDTYIISGDYTTALQHAEGILAQVQDDDWGALEHVYSGLISIHSALGNKEQVEKYVGLLRELIGEISDANLHSALQEMTVKYDVQGKELEIVRQRAEIERKNMQRTILVVALGLVCIILVLLWYMLQLRSRRNRILAETNATKDKFFSIISHDLKNPAIAQRNALQMLIEGSNEWSVETLEKYYEELLKSADGLVELLYNLLNWAQVQTGRMPYVHITFDLVSALRADTNLALAMAERKGLEFEMLAPQSAIVNGDSNMLCTVIRNLLVNAVKFTNENGKVSLQIEEAPGKVTISVADTGVGMTPAQKDSLFRIDRRQSRIGTSGEHGSGLGLIVCQELLERHGSTLQIESREGGGSRFWFELYV